MLQKSINSEHLIVKTNGISIMTSLFEIMDKEDVDVMIQDKIAIIFQEFQSIMVAMQEQ